MRRWRHHGHAFAKDIGTKDVVDLRPYAPEAKSSISRRFIAEIIESRLEEIFDLVDGELKRIGKQHNLPGGP